MKTLRTLNTARNNGRQYEKLREALGSCDFAPCSDAGIQ